MKNFSEKLTAIFTAAVMTVSSLGIAVSAAENTSVKSVAEETAEPKYTGWMFDESGWQYLDDGVPYIGYPRRIDGVYYHFSHDGYAYRSDVNTGLFMSGRRYYKCEDDLPYTGWTDDSKQYCLNGYPVTGDFQIGDTVYSFDKKGIYTGESSPAALTASCAEKVSVDAEKISITVKYNDGNDNVEYTLGEPAKMERWENGKWKRCGKPSQYDVDDIAPVIDGKDDCTPSSVKTEFYPNRYMGGDMTAGYYRIAVSCGEVGSNYSKTKRNVYAVFQAVPAVEVKPSEEIFLANDRGNATVSIIVAVNSNRESLKPEVLAKSLKLEIMKKTASGWEHCEDNGYSAGYTDNENELEISAEFPAEAGYYKAVINLGGKDYRVPFRVVTLAAEPWLDEYSLKSGDIAVSFTVYNRYDKPVKIGTDLINLSKKENGTWTDMRDKAASFDCIDIDPSYTTLKSNRSTALTFDLSDIYDTSKLTVGDYAVWIDGVGLAEFKLTDKEPQSDEFPFAGLKAEDIKEIQLNFTNVSMDVTTKFRGGSGGITNSVEEEDEYGITEATAVVKDDKQLERVIDYLRQFRLDKPYTKNDTYCGGTTRVIVRYKNNTKKTLSFEYSDFVTYNGKGKYYCNDQLSSIADDLIKETNKSYYASLGLT